MNILVHDYAGHPFQVQLSRQLAQWGHQVTHVYYADDHGPKGDFERRATDAPSLRLIGVTLGRTVDQTALLGRFLRDAAYGKAVARIIADTKPSVVLSANTPSEAQDRIIKACRHHDARFVFWLQDVLSVAYAMVLTRQLGRLGAAIGRYYKWLERKQFRQSDAIIAISEDFRPIAAAGSDAGKVTVIENWGVLEDIPVRPKDNPWARERGLEGEFVFLYSGTLGRKHNPNLLVVLAETTGNRVVVAAQGVAVPDLTKASQTEWSLRTLSMLPLQPANQFPDMLGTADVLVAMIEATAGTFAVPSKILSYMCAGRPILLAAPKVNLAAETVRRADCGIVVEPDDTAGFLAAALRLRDDAALRARLGANARAYAERTFDIAAISARFETILLGRSAVPRPVAMVERPAEAVP